MALSKGEKWVPIGLCQMWLALHLFFILASPCLLFSFSNPSFTPSLLLLASPHFLRLPFCPASRPKQVHPVPKQYPHQAAQELLGRKRSHTPRVHPLPRWWEQEDDAKHSRKFLYFLLLFSLLFLLYLKSMFSRSALLPPQNFGMMTKLVENRATVNEVSDGLEGVMLGQYRQRIADLESRLDTFQKLENEKKKVRSRFPYFCARFFLTCILFCCVPTTCDKLTHILPMISFLLPPSSFFHITLHPHRFKRTIYCFNNKSPPINPAKRSKRHLWVKWVPSAKTWWTKQHPIRRKKKSTTPR